jgi:endonuclease/exonuclease/phosphatase family metal-dependent hydrolase
LRLLLWLFLGILLSVGTLGAVFLWASSGSTDEDPSTSRNARIIEQPKGPEPSVSESLVVATWNIGFAGGLTGVPTDLHDADEVRRNLSDIAGVLHDADVDIVLLQEVDLPSNRSGRIDQLRFLMEEAGYRHACFVTTWDVRYLPFPYWPPSSHLGRVHSGQAVLSRFPIRSCERIPLPQPSEYPWWYRRFFLHRALQAARLDLGEGQVLEVVNVHFEAFSRPNREEQAGILAQLIREPAPGLGRIVGGDLNTVPETASKQHSFQDEEIDFRNDTTLGTVRGVGGLREVFLDDAADEGEAEWHTFPAAAPNRRLDYLFGQNLGRAMEQRVIKRTNASDHLPVLARYPLQ